MPCSHFPASYILTHTHIHIPSLRPNTCNNVALLFYNFFFSSFFVKKIFDPSRAFSSSIFSYKQRTYAGNILLCYVCDIDSIVSLCISYSRSVRVRNTAQQCSRALIFFSLSYPSHTTRITPYCIRYFSSPSTSFFFILFLKLCCCCYVLFLILITLSLSV